MLTIKPGFELVYKLNSMSFYKKLFVIIFLIIENVYSPRQNCKTQSMNYYNTTEK